MRWVVVLALAGCSDAAQLDDLLEGDPIVCYSYSYSDFNPTPPPTTTAAEAAACLNDALESDGLAMAMWSSENFYYDTEKKTYVFADGGDVRLFHVYIDGRDRRVEESDGCSGPFRVSDDGSLAWDGCK